MGNRKIKTVEVQEHIYAIVDRLGTATVAEIRVELSKIGYTRSQGSIHNYLSEVTKPVNACGHYKIDALGRLQWEQYTKPKPAVKKKNLLDCFKNSDALFKAAVDAGLVTPCGIVIGSYLNGKCYAQRNCHNGLVCKIAVPGSGTRQACWQGSSKGRADNG